MSSLISVTFPCSFCPRGVIRGEFELEDFDYPVFCPACGRQNQLPRQGVEDQVSLATQSTSLPAQEPISAQSQPISPPASLPHPPQCEKQEDDLEIDDQTVTSQPLSATMAVAKPIDAQQSNPVVTSRSLPNPSPKPVPIPTSRNRIAWRFRPASNSRPVVALRNCVAVDDRGRIFAALGAELYALIVGPSGCEVDWKFVTGDHIPASPVIGNGGVVFVHSSDGMLHAVAPDGSLARASTKVGPALGWATPLVDESERIWICASTGGLVRVDASGQTNSRPFFRHPNRFDCTGALRGNVVYVGSEDQFLHAIDLQQERGLDRWSQPGKIGLTGWCINSAIALHNSCIVAVSRDDQLYSFDETGAVAWTTLLNGRAFGSPVIGPNGIIVIGLTIRAGKTESLTGQLLGIHGKTGQVVWRLDVDAPVESTPVIGDGSEIYFGDNGGKVHAVNGQGQRVWSESVGSAVRSAGAFVAPGQVVFGLDDGSLTALRCSSQSLGGPWPKLLATATNRCPAG